MVADNFTLAGLGNHNPDTAQERGGETARFDFCNPLC